MEQKKKIIKHHHDYRSDGRSYCYCIKCGKNKFEAGYYFTKENNMNPYIRLRLKKDIVIKAGTIFSDAPIKTIRFGDHIAYTLGLTKNTTLHLTYAIDYSASKELERWFEVISSAQKRRK